MKKIKKANRLIVGDCLEVLRRMKPGSVDLVFGSPPYEDARKIAQDGFQTYKGQEWVDWVVEVVIASLRVCTGLVAFVVQGRTKNYSWSGTPALLMADLIRRGVALRDPIIYHRIGIPGSGGPEWLRHDCEYIVCATNGGKLPWSDNTAMGHPPKFKPGGQMSYRNKHGERVNSAKMGANAPKVRKWKNGDRPPGSVLHTKHGVNGIYQQVYVPPEKANPGNLVTCGAGKGNMGSELCHKNEAPFPERLAEFMIRTFCRLGGIVLDCFAGSGTVPAVALKTGRRYIGIDCRQSQIELCKRRLAELESEK